MYNSITELKRKNKQSGSYWFSPKTMRFFKCKIESEIIHGKYFVTSESNGQERKFSARIADEKGNIRTIGTFHNYTKEEALAKIEEHYIDEERLHSNINNN
jgi:hypothetical protein